MVKEINIVHMSEVLQQDDIIAKLMKKEVIYKLNLQLNLLFIFTFSKSWVSRAMGINETFYGMALVDLTSELDN